MTIYEPLIGKKSGLIGWNFGNSTQKMEELFLDDGWGKEIKKKEPSEPQKNDLDE